MTASARCNCDRLGWYISDFAAGALLIGLASWAVAIGAVGWWEFTGGAAIACVFVAFAVPAVVQIRRNHEAGRCPRARGGRS